MANEFKHADVGDICTKPEFEHVVLHVLDGQEPGDMIIASTATQLSRQPYIGKNAIINGDFRVAQRGTSFTAATSPANNDDSYLLDRWILLSDGNDIVDVTQVVRTTPNGSYAEMKSEVETANKQFGHITILEAKDSARFIGKTVSLSFKARMAAVDDNTHSLKAVILAWSGTADVVTSDVVNVWGATPTYVANWTAENVPASQALTTTEQTFKVEGVPIDTASAKNIAIFIFCDQTDGVVDDAVIITEVQIELGLSCTNFNVRPYQQELALCKRYTQVWGGDNANEMFGLGYGLDGGATDYFYFVMSLGGEMRVAPTVTYSSLAHFLIGAAAGGGSPSAIGENFSSKTCLALRWDITSCALTTDALYRLSANATTAARLIATSEL